MEKESGNDQAVEQAGRQREREAPGQLNSATLAEKHTEIK